MVNECKNRKLVAKAACNCLTRIRRIVVRTLFASGENEFSHLFGGKTETLLVSLPYQKTKRNGKLKTVTEVAKLKYAMVSLPHQKTKQSKC